MTVIAPTIVPIWTPRKARSQPRNLSFSDAPPLPVLLDQVLGQVEAHINSLRAQLQVSPNRGTPDGVGMKTEGNPLSSPGCSRRSVPTGAEAAAAAAATVGGAAQTPAHTEARAEHHVPRTPPSHDGNEDGLTEMEDMRLNRLLRSTNPSLSSPIGMPSPSSSSCLDRSTSLSANRISGSDNETSPVVRADEGDSHRRSNTNLTSQGRSRLIHGSAVAGDEPGLADYLPSGDTPLFGMEGVSRELFRPSPKVEAGSSTRNSCFFGGEPSRRTGAEVKGGGGVAVVGRGADLGREGDDLEDISDGGFHPGCWRRKYVCGEMR